MPSAFDQAALGVFKHGLDLLSGYAGEPFEKIIHTRAILEILEERLDRNSRALKQPGAADLPRFPLHSRTMIPVEHMARIRQDHARRQARLGRSGITATQLSNSP